jgi:hypothetical protein
VANLLSQTLYGSFGATPQLAPLGAAQAEAFGYHVHSHVMHGPPDPTGAELVAAAVKDEVDRLLSCAALIPAGISGGSIGPLGSEPLFTTLTGPPAAPRDRPGGTASAAPYPGDSPYLFISYARKDGDIVYPLIQDLSSRGVATWIDRRILGGEDWVAELEARLINCAGVLALISPSFVASKYCPREVHFADALNRPIVPVSLTPEIELGRGLKFLLNTMQIINFHQTKSIQDILLSIRKHTPQACFN